MQNSQNIRLSLPSKGRLESDALDFLSAAGLRVFKPNPRQYQAEVPALPELGVIFQRPGDIVVSVRQGSIDFGITGLDAIEEKRGDNGDILILHDALGFDHCALKLAIPESWKTVMDIASLKNYSASVPVIASGGAEKSAHFADILAEGKADAALAASLFHDGKLKIPELKKELHAQGVVMRL